MTPYIPLITSKFSVRIPLADILYLHQKSRKLEIVTKKNSYEYYGRMETLAPYLDERFLTVLHSVKVNLEQVERMEEQTIFFQNGQSIILGRCNFIKARQGYSAWLQHRCCEDGRNDAKSRKNIF